ncbi:MAPEG family protein [Pseudomonas indica]|uniref:MAPEG family protein n=1 Tax=Pseudomonas indica TaxID=137658 RepID=UPI003FD66BAE
MEMIYPMFALVLLKFGVGLSLGISRVLSVKRRQVDPRYYRLFCGSPPPEHVQKLGRNFSNLFEVPMLFYIAGVMVIALGIDSLLLLALGWAFVVSRIVHSAIHITYNNSFHRFLAYLVSSVIVLVMWIDLVVVVGGRG